MSKIKSSDQNLYFWMQNQATVQEVNRNGHTSRHINELNILSIKDSLEQFNAHTINYSTNNAHITQFVIYLKDTPFFMNSNTLKYDIDIGYTPPEFFLTTKALFLENKNYKHYFREIILLHFTPNNLTCDYIVNTNTDKGIKTYSRMILFRSKNEDS